MIETKHHPPIVNYGKWDIFMCQFLSLEYHIEMISFSSLTCVVKNSCQGREPYHFMSTGASSVLPSIHKAYRLCKPSTLIQLWCWNRVELKTLMLPQAPPTRHAFTFVCGEHWQVRNLYTEIYHIGHQRSLPHTLYGIVLLWFGLFPVLLRNVTLSSFVLVFRKMF